MKVWLAHNRSTSADTTGYKVALRKIVQTNAERLNSEENHLEEWDVGGEQEAMALFATIRSILLFLGWKADQPAQNNLGGGQTVIFSPPQG